MGERARRLARSLRRGPAMTLVTVVGVVVGLVLAYELGGRSAEVVDRVGVVEQWTIGRDDEIPRLLARPDVHELGPLGVTVVGPQANVVEAYWYGRPCDTASRVTVEGSPATLRLLVEKRQERGFTGCDDVGLIYRLTLVADRPLAPGSVTGEVEGVRDAR